MEHTVGKALDQGYNFALDLITIGGLHMKLGIPKIVRVPIVGFLGLPLGNPETKSHLDVAFVERCRIYYKGEGDGFPQVWACESKLFVARPSIKNVPTMH
jgi:hypothetical protein